MKILKFKKFPHEVIYMEEVYTHRVGGNKNIVIEVEDKKEGSIKFIFQNKLMNGLS